jgi:LDH2 family malate/lactate/ureidoglycolate dehydrogenase
MKLKRHEDLHQFVQDVFLNKGFSQEHALICANVLIAADLRGIDSHGVARLSGYVRLIDKGRINPNPSFVFTARKKTMGNLDADGGIGLVSAHFAMEYAMEMCQEYGSGWVGIQNSNHFGIASYHALRAFEIDAVGFAMTNASPLVYPAGGRERMLGTNPFCVAIPGNDGREFVIDMATSAAANGKLEIASRSNKEIPEGWVLNREGKATKDPNALKNGGGLLPLGSDADHGFHKGYGLGAWVDIFSGVLTGANFGPWVPPFVSFLDPAADAPGKGIGHFVGCWSLDGFSDAQTAKNQLDIWIDRFKESIPADSKQPVIVPGEPERIYESQRMENGIPLNEVVFEDLKNLNTELKLNSKLFV